MTLFILHEAWQGRSEQLGEADCQERVQGWAECNVPRVDVISSDARAVPGWTASIPTPELIAIMVDVDVDIAHPEDQSSVGHAHRRSEFAPWPASSFVGVLRTRRS